ncbi:autotransporter outer membrane beta-barrel domain-containing protein [Pollutimonas bauzanensis]|uniref:autotransporter outer membrane beta-barrel domain-containing protein n=1 Tax=Pollutimonas bauzanensis TaxID=658167 RepID=UPI00333F530B
MTVISILMVQPALAAVNCPAGSSSTAVTCTVTQDQGGSGMQIVVDFINDTDGLHDGNSGGNYTVINSATLGPDTPITVRLRGEDGTGPSSSSSTGNGYLGGVGGTIHITNHSEGHLSATHAPTSGTTGSAPGIWDDTGAMFGISGVSVGGKGGNADGGMDGADGGQGGAGGFVSIDNSGSIGVQGMPYGGVGIYGASIGKDGGQQDSSVFGTGNQKGGDGGGSGIVNIINRGTVDLSSSNAGKYAWGIAAESIGSNGGASTGKGGSAHQGAASVFQNSGTVQVLANGSNLAQGVRGLYMLTQGGNGYSSNDGSDNGGDGGGFGQMQISNSGKVTVISDSAPEPANLSSLSGGIVMIGQGGNGGAGSTDEVLSGAPAGNGGTTPSSQNNVLVNIQLNNGSSITTQGDYLPGVNLALWGGTGGAGRNDSDGGSGGAGGAAAVHMRDGANISTDGAQSHGIVARSYGGSGGGHSSSGGIIDFTSNEAGAGGSGGAITVATGNASTTEAGGAILTRGDNSIGILGQSMGGIGGNTGYSFDWIYQPGNNGGNGGASGLVSIDSLSAITTYGTSSHGIVGQSISGGGGTGGTGAGISAVGGDGGTGAAGGEVHLKQSGNILQTHGSGAFGMLGQSIGGGGGDGGGANGVAVIGGSGKGGGNGGKATIEVNGYGVRTDGDHAHGLIAQSIGGGGGSGGAASAFSAGVGFSMAVAVGGSGDSGGAGSAATVNVSNATITTNAKGALDGDANGVVVQSIGGGGGAGGDSVARAMTLSVPDPEASFGMAVSYALGGTAGNGGSGGSATSTLANASVITYGDNSQGMVVQSIGGGGGIGGSASATSTVISTTGESFGGTVQSSLGGSGGNGGSGGTATHTLQGSHITTSGHYANAILLQSVGGGGGSGGIGSATGNTFNTDTSFSFTTALGGSGGSGGSGSTANLTIDSGSSVATVGDGARGAIVQSIGGGGGVSQGGQVGFDFSGSAGGGAGAEPESVDVGASVSIGRSGPGGGSGGTIHVSNKGNITTYGADADGLLVQSIGGGGGVGGAVGGDSDDGGERPAPLADSGVEYHLNAYLGGSGGDGGSGGNIGSSSDAVDLGGHINTFGDYADAVVVQSIGGGGGVGGASSASSSVSSSQLTLATGGRGGAGGVGGDITAFLDGNGGNGFGTEGYAAMGIVLQSIGGGGGMAGSGSPRAHGTISAGGFGNRGGNGGKVVVSSGSFANIATHGDSAYGLVIQSVGGGGGIAVAGSTTAAENTGALQFDLHAGSNSAVGTIVSTSAPHSFGGDINASTDLWIQTYGHRAMGVVAQSIGGGGGIVTTGSADGVGSVKLGANNSTDDGASAYGGNVALELSGGITTRGDGAHGIVAQSIGGGGGIVGDTAQAIHLDGKDAYAAPRPSGSSGANNTRGGNVSVAFDGSLQTFGANAHGIVAQSIGGGGGLAGSSDGGFAGSVSNREYSGSVSVTQSGSVVANGAGAAGIFAQSDAGSGRSPVKVVVNGAVQGGSGTGSGVWVADGTSDNHLTINAGGSVSALSNVAVRYDSEDRLVSSHLIVDNYGTLKGNLVCSASDGGKACTLNNKEGGVAIDAVVYKADVNNAGLLISGHPGGFQLLDVAGDFNQSSSGVLRADVDFDKMKSAHMIVQGDASLAGWVDVLPHALLPDRELTVLTVNGGLQGKVQAVDSPIFDYEARQAGSQTMLRVASADFNAATMGLGENQSQIANHLQRAWDHGGNSALAPLFGQLDLAARQGAGAYRESVADLSPGIGSAPAVQSAANLGQFTNTMLSCPAFTGVDAMTGERNCFWGLAGGRWTQQEDSQGSSGFDYDTYTYQFGGQREIRPGWFLGGSVAYENSRVRGTDGRVRGDGDSGYVGVVLKRQTGPWVFSAALGGGYGSYSMDRNIGIAGYQDTLDSRPDVYGFNARLRAARTFAYDNFYVKPYVDLDASYTRMPAYQESGSNPLALSVDGSDQFIVGLSPMIEFGGRTQLKNGATLRPYMYAGVSLLSENDWVSSARLRGAPANTASFNTSLPFDDVIGKVGAGLELTHKAGVDFRLQYDGQFSEHIRSHSVTLKAVVPF